MLQDTIIAFTTDNGGPAAGFDLNHASNWPLKGVCTQTYCLYQSLMDIFIHEYSKTSPLAGQQKGKITQKYPFKLVIKGGTYTK